MKALYRIISILAAAAAFPALYFLKIVHIIIELGLMDGYFDDSFSVKQITDILFRDGFDLDAVKSFLSDNMTDAMKETLMPLKTPLIVCGVFFCIMTVMLLAIIICSAFTNSKKVNICFSVAGFIAAVGTMRSFSAATAKIIDGTVGLGDIANAALTNADSAIAKLGGLLGAGQLVNNLGTVLLIRLDSAMIITMLLFIFIFIWSLSYVLINYDPRK